MRYLLIVILTAFMLTGSLAGNVLHAQSGIQTTEQKFIDGQTAYIQGLQAFENKNYEQALDLLSAAYEKLPENAGVNFALADAYLQTGDLSNAAFYAKKAADFKPENKWYHLKLAEIYRSAGRSGEVIEALQTARQYHPKAADILFELAQTYAGYGQLRKSNITYNQLLQLSGEDIKIRLQKLQNFNRLGLRDSIITELNAIRKFDPDNLSTLQTLSSTYREVNKPGEAKQILRDALNKNPRDPKTLTMLADIYASETRWDSVSTLLGSVISDPIVRPEAKLTVAQYFISLFQQHPTDPDLKQAASRFVDMFVAEEPDFAEAHALAADYYSQTNQHQKALSALEKTTKLNPSNESAWKQQLRLLLAQGNYEKAIEVGALAQEHVPQDPFIMFFWGSAHLAKGNNKLAAKKLEEASKLPARRQLKSAIYQSLGDTYARLENWDKTFAAYEQALKINPANSLVLNNYAYYLSLQDKELDKALQMARSALESEPQNPSFLDTLGWVYFQKGDYEQAQKYIQASIDTGRASAEVLEHMGDVMDKLGKPGQAREWWQKALQKDSTRTHLKEKLSR